MASLLCNSVGTGASARFVVLSSRSSASGGGRRQVRSTTTAATHTGRFQLGERAVVPSGRGMPTKDTRALYRHATLPLSSFHAIFSSLEKGSPTRAASSAHSSSTSAVSVLGSAGARAGDSSDSSTWNRLDLFACTLLALAATTGTVALSPSLSSTAPSVTQTTGTLHAPHIHIHGDGNGSKGGGKDTMKSKVFSAAETTKEKSYEISVRALQGQRDYMEDEFCIANGGRFSAVYDGHGGGAVSCYLRDRLYGLIQTHLRAKQLEETETVEEHWIPSVSTHVQALRSAFEQLDKEVLSDDAKQHMGSTAVVVVVHEGDNGRRTLLSANVGDSRAILSRNGTAVDLTRDHKPNDDLEKARILAMGETIEWDDYSKVHRIRNLSLSRGIGDRFAKPAVSGEVEIKHFPLAKDEDEFILLASDGLWDVMTSQQVVDFVHKKMDLSPQSGASSAEDIGKFKYTRRKHMSRYVANEALKRGSGDNVCVVMVWLQDSKFKPSYII